jgi:hypothetical protein
MTWFRQGAAPRGGRSGNPQRLRGFVRRGGGGSTTASAAATSFSSSTTSSGDSSTPGAGPSSGSTSRCSGRGFYSTATSTTPSGPEEKKDQGKTIFDQNPSGVDMGKAPEVGDAVLGNGMDVGSSDAGWEHAVQQGSTSPG